MTAPSEIPEIAEAIKWLRAEYAFDLDDDDPILISFALGVKATLMTLQKNSEQLEFMTEAATNAACAAAAEQIIKAYQPIASKHIETFDQMQNLIGVIETLNEKYTKIHESLREISSVEHELKRSSKSIEQMVKANIAATNKRKGVFW